MHLVEHEAARREDSRDSIQDPAMKLGALDQSPFRIPPFHKCAIA